MEKFNVAVNIENKGMMTRLLKALEWTLGHVFILLEMIPGRRSG